MLPSSLPIRFFLNPGAHPSLTYGPLQSAVVNRSAHESAFRRIASLPGYAPTPLRTLPGWADDLGIAALWYKDEGQRMGLGSFKALGGIYGVSCVLEQLAVEATGKGSSRKTDLLDPDLARLFSGATVTCASAGNHGRAVARGAQIYGCDCVVFLPRATSRHRVRAIQALGARTVAVDGSYDDAVAVTAREAEERGWTVVSDTTYPGYLDIPRKIMAGYTILAGEILDQVGDGPLPTHVFLQAGVGGLAGAVTGHFWEHLGPRRPRVVIVEPAEADGFLESALQGHPAPSKGSLKTAMECLACRTPSQPAWTILESGADAFLSIPDSAAAETVSLLQEGRQKDPPIQTQPSGAAGLAGLVAAVFEPALAGSLGLGEESRVLVIGSEGPGH